MFRVAGATHLTFLIGAGQGSAHINAAFAIAVETSGRTLGRESPDMSDREACFRLVPPPACTDNMASRPQTIDTNHRSRDANKSEIPE